MAFYLKKHKNKQKGAVLEASEFKGQAHGSNGIARCLALACRSAETETAVKCAFFDVTVVGSDSIDARLTNVQALDRRPLQRMDEICVQEDL